MVFLRSVHSGPESVRSSFCGPSHLEDSAFALSVDEPLGGPVVIRVTGDIDQSAVSVFGECVAEAIVCGRSLVVDLLDVDYVHPAGVSVLEAAAARLSSHRCRAMVVCTAGLQRQLRSECAWLRVEYFDTVAAAVCAAVEAGRAREYSKADPQSGETESNDAGT
ncbi:STAS domain-containing protein [Rhodococcus cercidiphylli]|uniref:STAS domain-containing protein n=1 Tax=Rhodococcus cercidiphylli TaxID=489916 RepID=A0ABU4AV09_9NOCA|nr:MULTISPECIES: STAS domain-containing protein [Rhodococcus]MDI6626563.1 STAS domain-containing protein [Rhodococcus sp. (in: high G+C Gram-positive bacteria)]MDV6230081.1 STAS domain-containing protein [Rhodococcus cercidiphylli]